MTSAGRGDGRPPGPAGADGAQLVSAENFRDVAGPGYRTSAGERLRAGVFYRGALPPTEPADLRVLAGLGIRGVHDLRRDDEVGRVPSVDLPGAAIHRHDVLGVTAEDAIAFESAAQTVAMMRRVYRDFVLRPGSQAALGTLLRRLAADEGAQLFHCVSGKDRTGWVAAVLLRLAGVDEETVLADYLLSNELTVRGQEGFRTRISESLGPEKLPVLEPILAVREEYLALSTDLVDSEYGGLEGYLVRGLGLGDAVIDDLRRRLLA